MQDKIIKLLAYDGKISIICANTTNLVEEARKIHDLSPVATAAFGRLLTISAIMAIKMKNQKDKLTVQIKGNGPIGTMLVTANNYPELKGYVSNPQIDLPLNDIGKLDVGKAVGNQGYINVIKDIGLKEPYIGISPLSTGEIADDFTNYFVNSEQIQSAVALGVLIDRNGTRTAGGYLITPMPDASEEEITKVEQSIFKAGAISKLLDQNLTLEEIAKKVEEYISSIPDDSRLLETISEIDNSKTAEEIRKAIETRYTTREPLDPSKAKLRKDITYRAPTARISSYQALNEEQTLEKNKIVAKLTLLERIGGMEPIIPHTANNNLLVQTIGNAFSSLELIHYGTIEKDEIVDVPKEIVDIFALLQQTEGQV